MARILIADDQKDVLEALRLLFKGEGHSTETASSPGEIQQTLRQSDFDLLLMDLNYQRDTTSGREGLNLLKQIRQTDTLLPIVVMTAWGSVELAVEAMRLGAQDFIEKPWDNQRLLSILQNQFQLSQSRKETQRLDALQQSLTHSSSQNLISQSPSMAPVMELIRKIGPSDAAILITGENGTGKTLIAQALHNISARSNKPFVTINMGGMSEGVFESEMFGHVKGAFTDAKQDRMGRLEMAEGGTLFLDEIANTPQTQQAKILRVLETGEYERVGSSKSQKANVRFLSATNADLSQEVGTGRFRQDLLFRLNTVEIHLPPLRNRQEDIIPLALHFLKQHRSRYRKDIHAIQPDAQKLLQQHPWPGNVRELNHALERAVLMASSSEITRADLGLPNSHKEPSLNLEDLSLEEVERYLIKRTLARCEGNARQAAAALGLSRSAFYRRLEKFGL